MNIMETGYFYLILNGHN